MVVDASINRNKAKIKMSKEHTWVKHSISAVVNSNKVDDCIAAYDKLHSLVHGLAADGLCCDEDGNDDFTCEITHCNGDRIVFIFEFWNHVKTEIASEIDRMLADIAEFVIPSMICYNNNKKYFGPAELKEQTIAKDAENAINIYLNSLDDDGLNKLIVLANDLVKRRKMQL